MRLKGGKAESINGGIANFSDDYNLRNAIKMVAADISANTGKGVKLLSRCSKCS